MEQEGIRWQNIQQHEIVLLQRKSQTWSSECSRKIIILLESSRINDTTGANAQKYGGST